MKRIEGNVWVSQHIYCNVLQAGTQSSHVKSTYFCQDIFIGANSFLKYLNVLQFRIDCDSNVFVVFFVKVANVSQATLLFLFFNDSAALYKVCAHGEASINPGACVQSVCGSVISPARFRQSAKIHFEYPSAIFIVSFLFQTELVYNLFSKITSKTAEQFKEHIKAQL